MIEILSLSHQSAEAEVWDRFENGFHIKRQRDCFSAGNITQ